MIIIGIDPGLNGGIAVLETKESWRVAKADIMPTAGGEVDAGGVSRILRPYVGKDVRVFIEKVGAMPKQGVCSMFKFGVGYGMVRAVAATMGYPVTLVMPPAWKKVVLKGLSHDKDGAARYCAMTFPQINLVLPRCRTVHDGLSDALCIASYGFMQSSSDKVDF